MFIQANDVSDCGGREERRARGSLCSVPGRCSRPANIRRHSLHSDLTFPTSIARSDAPSHEPGKKRRARRAKSSCVRGTRDGHSSDSQDITTTAQTIAGYSDVWRKRPELVARAQCGAGCLHLHLRHARAHCTFPHFVIVYCEVMPCSLQCALRHKALFNPKFKFSQSRTSWNLRLRSWPQSTVTTVHSHTRHSLHGSSGPIRVVVKDHKKPQMTKSKCVSIAVHVMLLSFRLRFCRLSPLLQQKKRNFQKKKKEKIIFPKKKEKIIFLKSLL